MDLENTFKHIETVSHQAIDYLSERANLEKIGKITAISVATYIVANKLYDAFLGPLGSVPGPFYAKFIEVPKIFIDIPKGTSFQMFRDFHDTYGPIVRLGPKTIAVSDKDLIRDVLVTEDLPKGPLYKVFQGHGKLSVFSATDKEWHKRRRRVVAPAFSVKYLKSLEPFMHNVTLNLINKIDRTIASNHGEDNVGQIDIWTLFKSFSLDVLGETAFGTSFDMINDNAHFIPKAINDEMRNGAISAYYPLLSKIFLKGGGKMNPKINEFLRGVIEARLNGTEKREDILQILIETKEADEQDDRLNADAIMGETALFLIAGSETISNTLGFTIINLLRTPGVLAKLYAELDEVHLEEGQAVFGHDQIKNLTYLNAVLYESMRIHTAAGSALPRITSGPTKLAHLNLEKDTVVMTTLYHIHTDKRYWPNPYEFKPERWIPEEQDNFEVNDLDAFFGFSAGSRNCIGKNFAMQEMRLCLASLLKNFEISPIAAEMEQAKELRTYITMTIASHTFDCKVRRRTL
ncbi:cytochrome P450 [Helicostylum pulchrum]|uniref:Cytochrome P450 n=1 Tax=Helicostylum pulchrum TaxID=562976 RepID=A0ABP9XUZ7_9FUNG|nr:cytochrome P450 [Helicostylum pulchrum]